MLADHCESLNIRTDNLGDGFNYHDWEMRTVGREVMFTSPTAHTLPRSDAFPTPVSPETVEPSGRVFVVAVPPLVRYLPSPSAAPLGRRRVSTTRLSTRLSKSRETASRAGRSGMTSNDWRSRLVPHQLITHTRSGFLRLQAEPEVNTATALRRIRRAATRTERLPRRLLSL